MLILNLGCGTRTSREPEVVNIDWSPYLRLKESAVFRGLAPFLLRGRRYDRFRELPDNIVVHDLSKGIPYEDGSVDVVYHSHMLEHLDRDVAVGFLEEVYRVLRTGGIHRIVVPDLESLCRRYLVHLEACAEGNADGREHDAYVAEFIEQCVRREAAGTRDQPPLRRWLENRLLGDARKRGETHQWMYDRINLSSSLEQAGFGKIAACSHDESRIPGWNRYGLDINADGGPYKPWSLYLEAAK